MDRARLDLWLARATQVLIIAVLVAAPLAMGALREQDFFWVELLGIAAGFLWIGRLLLNPQAQMFCPAMLWPLLAFGVYAIIRYFTSDLEYIARKELIRVLFYLLMLVLCLNHFHSARACDVAIFVLLTLAMGMSVFALRQYVSGSNTIWGVVRPIGYLHRASGTFVYPNHFAGFLGMLLPIGIAYIFLGTFPKWWRVMIAYCTAWILVGLYLTFSRAGWIAAIIGWVFLLPVLLRDRRRQIWAFILVVALIIGGLGWELKTGQIRERFKTMLARSPTSDIKVRGVLWAAAWNLWKAEPLWGAGPAHFDERFRIYRDPRLQMRPGRAHNDYLNMLADWGIAGASLLGLALVLHVWRSGRKWAEPILNPSQLNTRGNYYALMCGGFAATMAFLFHCSVDYQIHAPGVAFLFIALVSMLSIQVTALRQLYRPSFPMRMVVSVVLGTLLALLCWQAFKNVREQKWLNRADNTAAVEQRIAALQKALAIEPTNFQTAYLIGENYRLWAWEGYDNYKDLARQAIWWFDRASQLNPFDPYNLVRKGMCLDWLKLYSEAEPSFQRALVLDPNNCNVLALMGWHYFQKGDRARAEPYFLRSYTLKWHDNPIAITYLKLLQDTKGR